MESSASGETRHARDERIPKENNFDSRPLCQTDSKALEMCSKTKRASPWLSSATDEECEMTAKRSPVEHPEPNTCWREISKRTGDERN